MNFNKANILLFIISYLLFCLFLAFFYTVITFGLAYKTFSRYIFTRIIFPLMFLGPMLYSYRDAADNLPILSKIILLNPVTYGMESIKYSIFGGNDFLSFDLCILILIFSIISIFPILKFFFKKRLDLVC